MGQEMEGTHKCCKKQPRAIRRIINQDKPGRNLIVEGKPIEWINRVI